MWSIIIRTCHVAVLLVAPSSCLAFSIPRTGQEVVVVVHSNNNNADLTFDNNDEINSISMKAPSRRQFVGTTALLSIMMVAGGGGAGVIAPVRAADFTPGGTLVDRQVGINVGNDEASRSRKVDNSNVLFAQDYYFKFGTAAPWLEPDSIEFPKTMPFTRIQQRYDALKKYQTRILGGLDRIKALDRINPNEVADSTAADVYGLRPMGLLANNMLASENSGATNELFLARWYINEVYLLISDIRNADNSPEVARTLASSARKATNSYLTMMNRVITPKVGDKFEYL